MMVMWQVPTDAPCNTIAEPTPRFETREEAVAYIREHKGFAYYPGGTAIYREPIRVKRWGG